MIKKAKDAKKESHYAVIEEQRKLAIAEAIMNTEKTYYTDKNNITVEIPAYCAPTKVEGEENIEQGLTIVDKRGNFWVWIDVPVAIMPEGLTFENDSDYEVLEKTLQQYVQDYRNSNYSDTWNQDEKDGLKEEEYNQLKKKMLKSLYENKGFYIGKYEVGADTQVIANDQKGRKAYIQPDKIVYNWVTSKQAQEISQLLCPNDNNTSSLLFGIQWDLILKCMEEKGKSKQELTVNSSAWGNYKSVSFLVERGNYTINPTIEDSYKSATGYEKPSSSVLLTTGASDRNKALGIYDLAGNVREWSLEQYISNSSYPCTHRGGCFNDSGSPYGNASFRDDIGIDNSNEYTGFRVALF